MVVATVTAIMLVVEVVLAISVTGIGVEGNGDSCVGGGGGGASKIGIIINYAKQYRRYYVTSKFLSTRCLKI